jgi:BirA family biotin operon repressor/biotin-[acetyl-CoA-carboxylase] ligase
LLDERLITSELQSCGRDDARLIILQHTASTSDHLLELSTQQTISGLSCLAEVQSSGRGRRERSWHVTPYRNIALSVAWTFDAGLASLGGLGVAAGVVVAETLHAAGLDREIGLKWPNDIIWRDRKLGGLLIDVRGQHDGPCLAVIGLGINLSLADNEQRAIDQPHVTLEQIAADRVERNRLAAQLVHALSGLCESYPSTGFASWRSRWPAYDRIAGRLVRVLQGQHCHHGMAQGIDSEGAFLLRQDGGQAQRFYSGDVSVRLDR